MNITELISDARFTVLLGKNGAGKSTILRQLAETALSYSVKYVSPERGGTLKYDPAVDNAMSTNVSWLRDARQRNRVEQFREQSAVQFRSLEMLFLRELEKDSAKRADSTHTFDKTVAKINALLTAIKLVRSDKGFSVTSKADQNIPEGNISSGEAELIALSIEVLVFSHSTLTNKLLLLDEPDVHPHPDLQQKFVRFVEEAAIEHDMRVVIATHSTAIIGAFTVDSDLQIVPVTSKDQTELEGFRRSLTAEQILPVFGAHPLATVFNKSPVILVEGEDDRRVLDQIVRSGKGLYSFSPCVVGTVSEMDEWEKWLNKFLPALYDEPKAFSLRDLDNSEQTHIDDLGFVCRIRLNCYAMENLLLSKQCLETGGFTDINSFKEALTKWADSYPANEYAHEVRYLINNFDQRRTLKIKNIRNIIVALLSSNKPWEVLVGQIVATNASRADDDTDSVQSYLGEKAFKTFLFTTA
jgi:predicted ATP-dependent endonuclease of OLD family